jgi:hypothetical protein
MRVECQKKINQHKSLQDLYNDYKSRAEDEDEDEDWSF